jgi:ParB-like chromosome segregation protein Spo0J
VSDQPFQLLPALSAEEFAALRADISAHGIRVPVDVDEFGQLLDGHHRQQIAAELGIPCPTRVVAGLTEDDKRHHALAVNLARRHLSQSDKRALIAAEIEHDESRSDRQIARIVGVDHKTVGAVRRALRGESPHVAEPLSPAELADLQRLTELLSAQLAMVDADTAWLLAAGRPLDAVRALTEGLDAAIATARDDEMRSALRTVFEPRIRAVLGAGA